MSEDHDEQERVRGLLAAAGSPQDERVPDDVAARLDDVLSGLVAERAADATPSTGSTEAGGVTAGGVTDLSSRRRRRWLPGLAAAAAVTVVGVGVGVAMNQPVGGGSAASTADRAQAGAGAEGALEGEAAGPELSRDQSQEDGIHLGRLQRLHTGSLTLDVQRIEDFALTGPVETSGGRPLAGACVRPQVRKGDTWLVVRLDGRPGVLVLRAPADGRRTAEVYTCDEPDEPAAETTVESR